jgi:phosphatidate cytidylyltransferase
MQLEFSDLKKRIFISFLTIIILFLLIIFANKSAGKIVLAFFIGTFGAIAIYEYCNLLKEKRLKNSLPLMILATISIIISFFISSQYLALTYLPVLVFFIWIIVLFFKIFIDRANSIFQISANTFGLIYIAFPLGLLFFIIYPQEFKITDGRFLIFYLLFVTKITDVAAYFAGRSIGKYKLAPKISPKKTIEGAMFGLFFSICGSLGFTFAMKLFQIPFPITIFQSIILGIFIGVIAQIGDLCESLLKRDANIKDSNTLPGLGGILDMLDSLLFTIPVLYFYLTI